MFFGWHLCGGMQDGQSSGVYQKRPKYITFWCLCVYLWLSSREKYAVEKFVGCCFTRSGGDRLGLYRLVIYGRMVVEIKVAVLPTLGPLFV